MRRRRASVTRGKSETDSDTDMSDSDFHLPSNENEAVARGVTILRKMEFRAIRAADMNYYHSWNYGQKYTRYSYISTGAAGVSTIVAYCLSKYGFNKIEYPELLKHVGDFFFESIYLNIICLMALVCTVMFVVYFIACPKFLLPYLKEKEERHNNAGAAWQALEVKINGFLETMTARKLTSDGIRNVISEFAVERQEACKIACPEENTYKRVIGDPIRCSKRVHDRDVAYRTYKNHLFKLKKEDS